MRIYNVNPPIQPTTQTTSFKGLWGKEDTKVLSEAYYDSAQMCDMGTSHRVITKEYHPFLDETAEEIQDIIKKNTECKQYLAKDRNLTPEFANAIVDCTDYITEHKVKLMPRLEFSAAEFAAYKARELLSKAEMAVEDCLKIAKLQKYLRK